MRELCQMIHVSPGRSLKGCRVLVVEDEMLIAMATEDILEEEGCVVVGPVAKLPNALSLIAQEPIDAAVIDMNLAGVSSVPIAEALTRQGVPFVILTGYGELDLPDTCQPAHVLSKPFHPEDLVGHLRQAVTGKQYRSDFRQAG